MQRKPIPFAALRVPVYRSWSEEGFLLTCGDHAAGKYNTMTIGWGSLGCMWKRPMAMVDVAALIAGHDACGDAGCAHQEYERRGEVLAKTGLCFEQEFVDRIEAEPRRLEGVYAEAAKTAWDRTLEFLAKHL